MTENSNTSGNTSKSASFTNDDYYTFNLTIEKQVTGSMGDKNHSFPFLANITNNNLYYYITEGKIPVDDSSFSFSLKHGEKYYIYGLSPLALIKYTEKNDTEDAYTVSINTSSGSASVARNETYSTNILSVSDYRTISIQPNKNESATNVIYTNNLNDLSPTGIVFRIAPYILILLIGILLMIIVRKKHYDK